MALSRTFQKSFSGGEIAPTMLGRIDDPKYQNGATRLENMVALPQGPAVRRPGFELVSQTSGTAGRTVRLVPFDYSNSQAFAVELGSKVPELGTGTTVLVDSTGFSVSGSPFTANAFDGLMVECGGSVARIVDNDSSNVNIVEWNPSTPESGSTFTIYQGYARFHTAGQTLLCPTADAYVADLSGSITSNIWSSGSPHGLSDNDPIGFSGTLPPQLVEDVTYYASVVNPTSFQVRAVVDGPALTISNTGGSTKFHRVYEPGSLVSFGGETWYCIQDPWDSSTESSVVPGTDVTTWFQMPDDGVYEVPTPWGDLVLDAITYAQKNDVLRMANPLAGVHDLQRFSAARWVLTQVTSSPVLETPQNVSAIATPGMGQTFTWGLMASGATVTFTSVADIQFAVGDSVRLSAPLPGGFGNGVGETDFTVYLTPSATTLQLLTYTGLVVNANSFAPTTGGSTILRLVDPGLELDQTYVVTALDDRGTETEVSDAVTTATTNLFAAGAYNTITWDAVTGAVRYRVYKKKIGLFGFIGETEDTEFVDRNIGPDMTLTPPIRDTALSGTDQPNCVGWFQGRCVFGGGTTNPQRLLMTRSGTDSDLSYSLPTIDSDRINQTVSAGRRCEIRHVVPLQQLLLLGDTAVIRVTGANSDVITPSSIDQRIQSHVGASPISPVVASTTVLFCDARGGHLREAGFSSEAGGYVTGDASIRASHLFDGYDLVSLALTRAPYQIVWAVSTSGQLLGLTYVPEERVGAWHRHTTDGTFKSCCAIPDGDEDRLYVVVERTINGVTGNYIERMAEFAPAGDLEDRVYVDCAVVATTSSSTGVVTGLDHLTGESVAVLADGVVQARKVVDADGEITIAAKSASVVHVGLPYTSTVIPAPVSAEVEAYGQGRPKNVSMASLKVYDTLPFLAGPSDSQLRTAIRGTAAFTGEVDILQLGSWNTDGSVWLVQRDPVPMNLVAVTLKVAFGG